MSSAVCWRGEVIWVAVWESVSLWWWLHSPNLKWAQSSGGSSANPFLFFVLFSSLFLSLLSCSGHPSSLAHLKACVSVCFCVCVAGGSPDSQQRVWLPQWFRLAYSIYITTVWTTCTHKTHTLCSFLLLLKALLPRMGLTGKSCLVYKQNQAPWVAPNPSWLSM